VVSYIAKSNKRAASSRVSQKKSPSVSGNKNPPQIEASIKTSHRFRFVANGAGGSSATITMYDILDLLCVAISATNAFRICDAVKIKLIEIWGANSAGNASNSVQLEWLPSNNYGTSETHNDTAIGLQNIAHISTRPPKGSLIEDWFFLAAAGTDVNLFNLNVPQGGVVDIVLQMVLMDSDAGQRVNIAPVGATTGKFYCRALDSATSGATLVPVGYDTI
jgi:hypothetical protein